MNFELCASHLDKMLFMLLTSKRTSDPCTKETHMHTLAYALCSKARMAITQCHLYLLYTEKGSDRDIPVYYAFGCN